MWSFCIIVTGVPEAWSSTTQFTVYSWPASRSMASMTTVPHDSVGCMLTVTETEASSWFDVSSITSKMLLVTVPITSLSMSRTTSHST